jgi:hypothetical protein
MPTCMLLEIMTPGSSYAPAYMQDDTCTCVYNKCIKYSMYTWLNLIEEQRAREEEERIAREEQEKKEREEREKLKAEEEARFLEETNNLNKVLEGQREELDKWKEEQQRKIQVHCNMICVFLKWSLSGAS